MFDRAVAALKTEFKATALSEFNDKNNKQYHDRDLYVFCLNMSDGKITASANQALMGTDIRTIKQGRLVGQKIHDAMKGIAGRASPQWTTTSRSPEQPSPFQRVFCDARRRPGLRRRLLQIGSTREKIRGPRLSGRALIAPNGYFCATPSKAYSRMSVVYFCCAILKSS